MSKTKHYLSEKEIKSILSNYFGQETHYSISFSEEGSFNVVYFIRLEDYKEYVLKVAPLPNKNILNYEHNILKTEATILSLLDELDQIPIPEMLLFDNTRVLCESDYILMEKIDGCSLQMKKQDFDGVKYDSVMFRVGQINRMINTVAGSYFGYPNNENLQSDRWDTAFYKMVKSGLMDAKCLNVDLGVSKDIIINTCKNNLYLLSSIKRPYLVHWDLWDGNILVNDENVTGIIDFERALWGDPLMEFYFNEIVNGCPNECFLSGYGRFSFSEDEKKKRALYNIYLFIIMMVDHINRGLNDMDTFNWAKDGLKSMVEYFDK